MIETLFCASCILKEKAVFSADFQDLKMVVIADTLPSDAVPIIKRPSNPIPAKDLTVFDVADKLPSEMENDYTKLAGRSASIEGASIGNPDLSFIDDQELSEEDGLQLLDDLKKRGEKKEEKQNGETKNIEADTG